MQPRLRLTPRGARTHEQRPAVLRVVRLVRVRVRARARARARVRVRV